MGGYVQKWHRAVVPSAIAHGLLVHIKLMNWLRFDGVTKLTVVTPSNLNQFSKLADSPVNLQ